MTSAGPGGEPTAAVSDYRLATAVAIRLLGVAIVIAGTVVSVTAILVATLSVPRGLLSVAVAGAAVVVVAAGLFAWRPTRVVRLDHDGYRVRLVRGAGVAAGQWKDVDDVVAARVGRARCVVLRRRDGTTTTIPVDLIEGREGEFVRDLQARLTRGHGYRPLPRRG